MLRSGAFDCVEISSEERLSNYRTSSLLLENVEYTREIFCVRFARVPIHFFPSVMLQEEQEEPHLCVHFRTLPSGNRLIFYSWMAHFYNFSQRS